MDELAALTPLAANHKLFTTEMISEAADGWRPLAESTQKMMRAAGHDALVEVLDISTMSAQSTGFVFRNDSLVHNDVRADNAAWHPTLQTVRLIDWNWAQISDQRIDVNSLLVHVYRSGLDVTRQHASRLDADALQCLQDFGSTAPLK